MPMQISISNAIGGGGGNTGIPSGPTFDGFIMELTVTGSDAFQLRGRSTLTYNAQVDWGDGTVDTVTTWNGGSHVYASTGTYQVKISGTFPAFNYVSIAGAWKDYLTRIVQWGNIQWKSFFGAFGGFPNLTSLPTDYPDITGLTDRRPKQMFFQCFALTECDLSNWQNTGNFSGDSLGMLSSLTKATNINLTGWDTSGFTNAQNFMTECGRLTGGCTVTAPNLDWSSTDTMKSMFYRSCLLTTTDLSNWTLRTAGVTLEDFFNESGFLSTPTFNGVSTPDLSTWNNTSGLRSLKEFARNASALKSVNLTGWDTSNVNNMFEGFKGAQNLEEIAGLSTINVSSVTTASQMFYDTQKLHFTNHNFGTSWNNWAAMTGSFSQFFYRNGYSLTAATAGPTPTVADWSMPNATGQCQNLFKESRYVDGSTLTVNWNHPNCTALNAAFYLMQGVSTLNFNMTTTTALTNMLSFARRADNLDSITFGSNMDFRGVTTMQNAFFNIKIGTFNLVFDAAANFQSITNLVNFTGTASRVIATSDYDALLVRFEATNSNTVTLNAGGSQYTAGSAAATARAALIADHSWTITDGGAV